ncbi:unnamed protein product [Boreogadus saida]
MGSSSWDSRLWLLLRRTLVLLWLCALGTLEAEDGSFNGESWLRMYGYLPQANRQMSTMRSAQILTGAIGDMQRFYSLEVTGQMDQQTIRAMKRPRCGVPDKFGGQIKTNVRRKRYALTGHKWSKTHLTYSVQNYTPKIGEYNSYEAIRRAFKVWQTVTPLTFDEISYQEIKYGRRKEPDIMIFFASGFHGDSSPFDGEGGFLAHAYFPGPGMGGDTHFDSDEPWTIGDQNLQGEQVYRARPECHGDEDATTLLCVRSHDLPLSVSSEMGLRDYDHHPQLPFNVVERRFLFEEHHSGPNCNEGTP